MSFMTGLSRVAIVCFQARPQVAVRVHDVQACSAGFRQVCAPLPCLPPQPYCFRGLDSIQNPTGVALLSFLAHRRAGDVILQSLPPRCSYYLGLRSGRYFCCDTHILLQCRPDVKPPTWRGRVSVLGRGLLPADFGQRIFQRING